MILRHLRYFAAVAEHGSLARAAGELHLAQPALSRQIHALEVAVGVPLLERERRGVRLTNAGAALLAVTPALFETLEGAVARTRRAAEGTLGTLRIGLGRAAVSDSRVGRGIAAIRAHYPDVDLIVDEISALEQVPALRARRLDVGIGLIGERADELVESAALFDDRIDCVMVASSHPLSTRATINLGDLRADQLMVLHRTTMHGYSRLFDALRSAGITDWQELDSVESVYGAVAAGRGWTVAVSTLEHSPPTGTVVRPTTDLRVPISVLARWRTGDDRRLTSNAIAILRGAAPDAVPESQRMPIDASTHIEFRHLQALVSAAREGSLSRAAQRTGLTQSGIARRVHGVERAVGCRLLRREGSAVMLTGAGEIFCADAERVLALADEAVAHTRRSHRGMTRVCRVASLAGELTDDFIVKPMRELAKTHPEIAIEFHELPTASQREALMRNEVDLAIGGANPASPERPAIASAFLMDNPLECALLASSHRLAGRASLTPADLMNVPFLFLDRSTNERFYDLVTRPLARLGLSPDGGGAFNGARALWRVIADSAGWTIAPRSQRWNPPHGLVAIPIEGLSIPWGVRLLWRPDDENPSVKIVVDAILAARPESAAT